MSHPFQPSPGYRLFLLRLVQARADRGFTREELADALGLTPEQVRAYEAGEVQLDFAETRTWCLALDVPFTEFVLQLERDMDAKLTRDERVGANLEQSDPYARAAALPPASESESSEPESEVPTIQVLFFPGSDELPEVRRIPNTLEAKQELVGGLITTFDTGVEGTVGVAGDEALLQGLPFNRDIPPTGAGIFGPFLIAGDGQSQNNDDFWSLSPRELEQLLDTLCPELPQEQFPAFLSALDGGAEWMEMWN